MNQRTRDIRKRAEEIARINALYHSHVRDDICIPEIQRQVAKLYDIMEEGKTAPFKYKPRGLYGPFDMEWTNTHTNQHIHRNQVQDVSQYTCGDIPIIPSFVHLSDRAKYFQPLLAEYISTFPTPTTFLCDILYAVKNETEHLLTVTLLVFSASGEPPEVLHSFNLQPNETSWMAPDHHYLPISWATTPSSRLWLSVTDTNGTVYPTSTSNLPTSSLPRNAKLTFYMGNLEASSSFTYNIGVHTIRLLDGSYLVFRNKTVRKVTADALKNVCNDTKAVVFAQTKPLAPLSTEKHRTAKRHAATKEELEAIAWDPARVMNWCLDEEDKRQVQKMMLLQAK